MNTFNKKLLTLSALLVLISCSSPGGNNENTTILVQTTLGDIKIKLYDKTPIHRDNFIKLINSGFYEGVSFHRVIKEFMIQAGDPLTKPVKPVGLADTLNTYTIPAEINTQYFHKKGALAAARLGDDINPAKRSSGTQFYIVQGVKFTDDELNTTEQRTNSLMKQRLFSRLMTETADSLQLSGKNASEGEIQEIASFRMFQYLSNNPDFKLSEEQRISYKTIGGTPRLDGNYTVFGEVVEGLDVVDRIAEVQTDAGDKPVNDIKILKIKIVKN